MSSLLLSSKLYGGSSNVSNMFRQNKIPKESVDSINYYKKIVTKMHAQVNNVIIAILKSEVLNINLEVFNLKDLQSLSKIIGRFHYFKTINLINQESNKSSLSKDKRKREIDTNDKDEVKNRREQEKLLKQKNDSIIQAISKNLKFSTNIVTLKFNNIQISADNANNLTIGLKANSSLNKIFINNCILDNRGIDNILECFLKHEAIEHIDLSNSGINDNTGKLISRIITRQTQLRDQVIWMHGLRNEKAPNNELAKGLISINLDNNNLTSLSCEFLVNALYYDNYIRKLSLKNNNICETGVKLFNKLLNVNISLIGLDLRNNPGYDVHYQKKISFKLIKNISNLSKSNNSFIKNNTKLLSQFINPDCITLLKEFESNNQNDLQVSETNITNTPREFTNNNVDKETPSKENYYSSYMKAKIIENNIDNQANDLADIGNEDKRMGHNENMEDQYNRTYQKLNEIQDVNDLASLNDLNSINKNLENMSNPFEMNYNINEEYNDDVLFNNYSQDYNFNDMQSSDDDLNLDSMDSNNIIFYSFCENDNNAYAGDFVETRGEKLLSNIKDKLKEERENLITKNLKLKTKLNNLIKYSSTSHSNNTGYSKTNIPQYTPNPFAKATDNNNSNNILEKEQKQFNISNTNFNKHSNNNLNNISNIDMRHSNNLDKINISNINNNQKLTNDLRISGVTADKSFDNNKTPTNKLENLVNELNSLMEIFEKTKTSKIVEK